METKNKKWILRPGKRPVLPWAERQPEPKPKTIRPKKRTLAKRPKKTPRPIDPVTFPEPVRRAVLHDDRWRLGEMGLGDLIVETAAPPIDNRRTTNPSRWRFEKAPGTRTYDAILRVMTPGRLHRMGDLVRACGLPNGDAKRLIQSVLPELDLLERIDAEAYAERHGPRTKARLKGYRNLWRLTDRGVVELGRVQEADRALNLGRDTGGPLEATQRL